jgi:hypothetical protein
MSQLLQPGYMLCWAAKWLGESEVYFGSIRKGQGRMVREIHALMSEADAICTYNGNKFDLPTLNKEILMAGLLPPAPSKSIDLLRVVKARFRFPMNKLNYVAQQLDLGAKVEHEGHELWIKCMAGDDDAWRRMCSYNIQDVRLLERLFHKIRPWIKGLPNAGLHSDDAEICPKCGSDTYQRRGFEYTASCTYQRFQCCKCGGWFRSTRNIGPKAGKKFASL